MQLKKAATTGAAADTAAECDWQSSCMRVRAPGAPVLDAIWHYSSSYLRVVGGVSTVSTGRLQGLSECEWLDGCLALRVYDLHLDLVLPPTTTTRDSWDGIPAHPKEAPIALCASCCRPSPPGVSRVKPVCSCKCLPGCPLCALASALLPRGVDKRRRRKGPIPFLFLLLFK